MAIITISRGTYSGGKELAEHISKELGYRLLSREQLLTDAAKEFGVSEDKLETALTFKPSFLESLSLRRIHYICYVQAAMAKEVQTDNVVYHGQAGHLLLHGVPHHLRLKVVADMEYRINEAIERSNFSRERAIKYVHTLDEERDRWVKAIYGVDRNDPSTYDVIINLEKISISAASDIAKQLATTEFKTTPESQKIVDNLVMASEIRAKIGLHRHIHDDNLEVEVEDGVVTLCGTVRSSVDADMIRELVRELPNVKDIVSKMGTRW